MEAAPRSELNIAKTNSDFVATQFLVTEGENAMATLQERLEEFKKSFESGAPPCNAPGEAIEKMHRETAQLKGDRYPGRIHRFVTLNRLACIPAAQSAILQARSDLQNALLRRRRAGGVATRASISSRKTMGILMRTRI
jgi:hypothetical protein